MNSKKIIVIGGGPAGMMAAIRAAQLRQHVTLLEKKSALGSKLLLSGKGRCNLTNACGLDQFLRRFSRNGSFLRDSFKKFFNKELIDFFESRGLKLKTERQERVFPVSDRSASVLDVLKKEIEVLKVNVIYKAHVTEIAVESGRVKSVNIANSGVFGADAVILATGGASYAFTGSSGDGQRICEGLGHAVTVLRPGLLPLRCAQKWVKDLEGLTLRNIRLTFSDGKKEIVSDIGELVFTGFGISGPLVLTLSARVIDWLEDKKAVSVGIDLKPALNSQQLDARLLRELAVNSRKSIRSVLKELLPQRLVDCFLRLAKINPDKH